MLGVFGSLTMLTSFACVKFMPVADAITLIFTAPLFTIVLAAVFMKDKVTIIKTISGNQFPIIIHLMNYSFHFFVFTNVTFLIFLGVVLMAGIVLVTKPSFLFNYNDGVFSNESWAESNISYDWRKGFEENIFLWFDPRSMLVT